jgi:hypothetical protein
MGSEAAPSSRDACFRITLDANSLYSYIHVYPSISTLLTYPPLVGLHASCTTTFLPLTDLKIRWLSAIVALGPIGWPVSRPCPIDLDPL